MLFLVAIIIRSSVYYLNHCEHPLILLVAGASASCDDTYYACLNDTENCAPLAIAVDSECGRALLNDSSVCTVSCRNALTNYITFVNNGTYDTNNYCVCVHVCVCDSVSE